MGQPQAKHRGPVAVAAHREGAEPMAVRAGPGSAWLMLPAGQEITRFLTLEEVVERGLHWRFEEAAPDEHEGRTHPPAGWFACQCPERVPHPTLTLFSFDCHACLLVLEAQIESDEAGVALAADEEQRILIHNRRVELGLDRIHSARSGGANKGERK